MTTSLWIQMTKIWIKSYGRTDSVLPWDDGRKESKYSIFLLTQALQLGFSVEVMLSIPTENSWLFILGVKIPSWTTIRCWMRVWPGRPLNSAIYQEMSLSFFHVLCIVTDTIKDSVQRTQHCCMFTVGFVLEFHNSRKTFMSYDNRLRNSKLYKTRSAFTVIYCHCFLRPI